MDSVERQHRRVRAVISAVRISSTIGFILADRQPRRRPAVRFAVSENRLLKIKGVSGAAARLPGSDAAALGRGFGPVFRAEKSKARRHLTESWSNRKRRSATLDVRSISGKGWWWRSSHVLDKRRGAGALERAALESWKRTTAVPVPRRGHYEASQKRDNPSEWGGDRRSDETILSQQFGFGRGGTRHCQRSVLHGADPERPELALCVDVLAPEGVGEIIGGSQRLASYDVLLQRIRDHNLPQEAFEWYLDLRRFGSVPHGGFGMGIERVVGWICGLEHVREAAPFPRMMYRVTP